MKKTILSATLVIILTAGVSANTHASLASNATLLIGPQSTRCYLDLGVPGACEVAEIPDANYWGIDTDPYDGVAVIEEFDLVAIEAGANGGIVLGSVQEPGDIDAEWEWFGALGSHTQAGTLSIASDDGAGNVTLDMTGWNIVWNGGDINLDWRDTHYSTITCGNTCENGDTFTLDYDNFYLAAGGFPSLELYTLHLSGTISAVPVPSAVWLFSSGLIGLMGLARRKAS